MTTFQVEPVAQWEADCKDRVFAHWQELGRDQDLEIAPNYEVMAKLEEMGMFKVITVRDDSRLIGYMLVLINEHLHYRTSPKMFIVDAYYVAPECRTGTGVKLIRFAETLSRELGAIKIYLTCKVNQDHSQLFLALGYELSDFAFTKRI